MFALLRRSEMAGKLARMRELPSGTVTLLFTDIEGSTRLLHASGASGYAELQAIHRQILREAMAAGAGAEVDTQGDAFFFAFPDPIEAVLAADRGRSALAHHDWPPGREIRVRMGLHVGTPVRTDEGYVGEDVNKGARIGALGAGGQILLSEDLAAIVVARADLSPVVVDVGDHRLKDFDRTEHLYQFGDVTFPPIRSIGTLSLPDATSSFVGRDNDLYEALSIMLEERPRLLTIRGPGGVGKTRFSIELARTLRDEHPGGTFFVELAPLTDPSTVLAEVAKAIGVTGPTRDAEAIAERVGLKDTLVLLDNAEHVLGTAKDLAILLQLAPALSIIMTSRSPMAITAERVFELSPMPDDMSVTLFLDRARTSGRIVERDPDVDELCRRLDGLPLAIELAAARTPTFSPAQLVEMIRSQPSLLRGPRDVDPRHQTLVNTVRWSYDLLSDDEQRLFASLSVFAGSCSWSAAQAICDANPLTLASLVDSSLVRRSDDADPRYWMLETIRSVASMELDASGDRSLLAQRLEDWLIEAMEIPDGRWVDHGWATMEVDNLRVAIRTAIEQDRSTKAYALLMATWMFWLFTGRAEEGERMWTQLIAKGELLSPEELGECIAIAAENARFIGEAQRALELQRRSIALLETAGNEASLAGSLHDQCETLAGLGRVEEAEAAGRRALEIRRRLGAPAGVAHAMDALATVEESRGKWERALEIKREALPLARSRPRLVVEIELSMALDYLHLASFDDTLSCLRNVVPRIALKDELDMFSEVADVLACLTAGAGQSVIATRLLGAGAAIRHVSGLSGSDLLDLETLGHELAVTLPADEFEAELALWSTCSLDEALELVTGFLIEPPE